MKREDVQKYRRDRVEADIIQKYKEKVRMTIRSKAAKTIEIISCMVSSTTHSFFIRKVLK